MSSICLTHKDIFCCRVQTHLCSFQALIDSYINVDWDEFHIGKTAVRTKSHDPKWNEEFSVVGSFSCFSTFDIFQSDVHSGKAIGFTVFHNCVMPPDDFVANCRISFDELKIGSANDIWVCSFYSVSSSPPPLFPEAINESDALISKKLAEIACSIG